MKIERRNGRIWFGEGWEQWSFNDPRAPEHKFSQRDHAYELTYLLEVCPTTKLACEKLALIRRALRTVPYPEEAKDDK